MATPTNIPNVTLNNGVKMPQIGLGVWEAGEGDDVKNAIQTAFDAGYRLIDTAKAYGNEHSVGEAVRASGLPRDEIFITTKLWNADQGYDEALKAFDTSLHELGMDYVDLYLIHWPLPMVGKYKDTWRALEKLYADKRARAIGVCNFKPDHLAELLADAQVAPAINQIELHPHMQQADTRAFCAEHNIQVESYSPLKRGGDVLDEPVIRQLADDHDKTPAQIVLRWHVQEDLVVIPKSVTPERIAANIDIFDFELSDDEIKQLRDLNRDERHLPDPDTFDAR